MENQTKKKITWEIKNFSMEYGDKIYSDEFIVGGCKWRLCACLYINYPVYLYFYLEVADYRSLPSGWRRHARYLMYPLNQNFIKHSEQNEEQKWFDQQSPKYQRLGIPLNEILDNLINGELKMAAEVEVLEVIGKLDVSKSKMTSTIMEDVNGFQVLSSQHSQVELVTHMFERHPEIASGFRLENPNLRRGYISMLHSLVEAMLYSPRDLQKSDLAAAYALLGFMTESGFKLDWLKKKLDEMSKKKEKEEAGETRMQEIEEELKDLKQKCSVLEAELEKEKSEVLSAKAPISFDDFF